MLSVTTTRTNPFPARFVSTEPRRRYRGPRRQVSGQIAVSYLNHGPKQWLIPGHAFNPASESIGPLSRIADLPFRVRLVTCSREPHSRAIYIYMYMYMCIRSFYGKESDFLRSTLTPRQERRPIEGDRNRDYATEERGGGEDRPSSFLSSSLLFPSFPPQHASSLLTLMRWPAGRFLQHRPFQLSPIHRDGVPSRDSSCIVKWNRMDSRIDRCFFFSLVADLKDILFSFNDY